VGIKDKKMDAQNADVIHKKEMFLVLRWPKLKFTNPVLNLDNQIFNKNQEFLGFLIKL
jgi:hypothetical protein